MNKLALFLIGLLVFFVATESNASAWSRTPFPFELEGPAGACIVAAASPSKEHPWGTAFVFDATSDEILAFEWDLFRNREIRRRVVAKQTDPDVLGAEMLRVVRSRDRIFLLTGTDQGTGMVALFELDVDANVLSRESITNVGGDPDLAVDDDWIVVGYYGFSVESRGEDVLPFPLLRFYHASVRERGSRRVVGARAFRNGGYLSGGSTDNPHLVLLGGRSYFALQDDKNTYLLSARLPSLSVERQVTLPTRHGGSIGGKDPQLYAVGRSLVVLGDAWYEYGPTLDPTLTLPGEDFWGLAANATGTYVVLSAGRIAPRQDTTFVRTKYANAVALVWGRPMYVRLGASQDDPRVVAVGP